MQRFPSQIISPGELAQLQLVNGKNANRASHLSAAAPRLWTANVISFFLGISVSIETIFEGGRRLFPGAIQRVLEGREQLRLKFEEIILLGSRALSKPHFLHLRSQLVPPKAALRLKGSERLGPRVGATFLFKPAFLGGFRDGENRASALMKLTV